MMTVHTRYTPVERIVLVFLSILAWPLKKASILLRKCIQWLDDFELTVL